MKNNKGTKYRCNICGKVVVRDYGGKVWTTSFCLQTGKEGRWYRMTSKSTGDD